MEILLITVCFHRVFNRSRGENPWGRMRGAIRPQGELLRCFAPVSIEDKQSQNYLDGVGTISKLRNINAIFALSCGLVAVGFLFRAWLSGSFSSVGFMPHGHCYLWQPSLVTTMVITDVLIGLAYVSISLCLYVLVRRIQLPFSAMFLAFGLFIAACGTTHFMEVLTLWYPAYWAAAFVKVITAMASVATALIMFPLFPRVIEFASAARLSEERKKQLEVLNLALEARTQELMVANRELEAFSYSVSHDLRSPLRGIDGFSKALSEDYKDRLDPQAQEYLGFVRTGAQRMGQIIDDLLNLARVTRLQVRPQNIDLSSIARETLDDLAQREPQREVTTLVQEGMVLKADSGLLRNVMENLLSNAWKFTGKSIGAHIEVGAMRLTDPSSKSDLVYFVRDNGAGFDMAYASKLFGPFQRMHSVEEFAGTGIGLATTRRILERHGGSIRAESAPGKGTTFYFTVGEQHGNA